jgi:hypothetical protein
VLVAFVWLTAAPYAPKVVWEAENLPPEGINPLKAPIVEDKTASGSFALHCEKKPGAKDCDMAAGPYVNCSNRYTYQFDFYLKADDVKSTSMAAVLCMVYWAELDKPLLQSVTGRDFKDPQGYQKVSVVFHPKASNNIVRWRVSWTGRGSGVWLDRVEVTRL